MEDQTQKLLSVVEKTAAFGRDTVGYVSMKVDNPFLAKELRTCHSIYSKTKKQAENKLDNIGEHAGNNSNSAIYMVKTAMKSRMKKNLHAPKTAKMMIEVFTMGNIRLCKALNDNTLASPDARTLAKETVEFQKKSIDIMQTFL